MCLFCRTSAQRRGILGSVASSLAATLYQGNPDRNQKLWNIVSTERYVLHMQVLLECTTDATMKQELLTLSEHINSPWFLLVFVLLDFQFYVFVL
jgi:hypothetical protein